MQTNLVIKATYAIQLFIALLFLFAGFMEVIRKKNRFRIQHDSFSSNLSFHLRPTGNDHALQ